MHCTTTNLTHNHKINISLYITYSKFFYKYLAPKITLHSKYIRYYIAVTNNDIDKFDTLFIIQIKEES